MGEGEGGKLGSGGEASIRICKIIPQDSLCRPDGVAPTGAEFFERVITSVGPLFSPLYATLMDYFLL